MFFRADNTQLLFKQIDKQFITKLFLPLLDDLNTELKSNPMNQAVKNDIDFIKEKLGEIREQARQKNTEMFIRSFDYVERMLNRYDEIFLLVTDRKVSSQKYIDLLDKKYAATAQTLRTNINEAYGKLAENKLLAEQAKELAPTIPTPATKRSTLLTSKSVENSPQFEAMFSAISNFAKKALQERSSSLDKSAVEKLQELKMLADQAAKYEIDNLGKIDIDTTRDYIQQMFVLLINEEHPIAPPKATKEYYNYSNILKGLEDGLNQIKDFKEKAYNEGRYVPAAANQPSDKKPTYSLESQLNDLLYEVNKQIETAYENEDKTLPALKKLQEIIQELSVSLNEKKNIDWKAFEKDVNRLHSMAKKSNKTLGIFGESLPNIPVFVEALAFANQQQLNQQHQTPVPK